MSRIKWDSPCHTSRAATVVARRTRPRCPAAAQRIFSAGHLYGAEERLALQLQPDVDAAHWCFAMHYTAVRKLLLHRISTSERLVTNGDLSVLYLYSISAGCSTTETGRDDHWGKYALQKHGFKELGTREKVCV